MAAKDKPNLSHFFEHSQELMAVLTQKGHFHEFSSNWVQILGWSPEELRSKPFQSWIHSEDLFSSQTFQKEKEYEGVQSRFQSKEGSERWLKWSAHFVKGFWYLTARDETVERKTKDLLRSTFDVAKLGGWEISIQDMMPVWSEETYRIFEMDPGAQVSLAQSFEFFIGEGRTTLENSLRDAIHEGKKLDLELPVATQKRNRIWVRLIGQSTVENGRTIKVYGTIQDVTLQKRMREELEKNTTFLEQIVDNIPNMVFVKDARELRFLLFNKAGERLLGLNRHDLMGKNDFDFFPEEQASFFQKKDRRVLENQKKLVIEEEPIDTPSGKKFLRTVKVPVCDVLGNPLYLLGISDDITEQKKTKELVEKQNRALHHASKMSSLGEMAGGIAHEINSPLAIIQGYARKISRMKEEEVVREFRSTAQKISKTTERIAKIVNGLRVFSREGSRDPFVKVNVRQIVDDTLELCSEKFKSKSIEVRTAEGLEDLFLECRPVEISQVLLNLMQNAYDAVLETGDAKWVSIAAEKRRSNIVISLTDSGAGIPEEIADRILEPFYTTKEIGRGTGLGLSISTGIVESHGGSLKLNRHSSHTCFEITLPLERVASLGVDEAA